MRIREREGICSASSHPPDKKATHYSALGEANAWITITEKVPVMFLTNVCAHLSLRVGHQLSSGPLQVGEGISKHLRTSDGAHGCGCGHLAGQWVQLLRGKKKFHVKQQRYYLFLFALQDNQSCSFSVSPVHWAERPVWSII